MIQVRDLHKYYGDRRALGPVSFAIDDGQIVGFLGLNGAGKTTCLRILACDLLPTSGQVLIDGEDAAQASLALRARVGFLPEQPPVYPEMTVRAYLQFAGRLRGLRGAELTRALGSTEERTGLREHADELVGNLSHGYRQRVGIAQALIHRPRLLILDEPFTGLDPVQIVEMRAMIRGLHGQQTILLSSHNLGEISETCDRILMIRSGEIVASGTEAELSARLLTGMRVELEVRGAREAVLARLRGVPGVTDATPGAEHDGVVAIAVQTQGDVRELLCRELVGAGFGVLRVDRSARELESVFLSLAGGGAARAAGNGAPAAAARAEQAS